MLKPRGFGLWLLVLAVCVFVGAPAQGVLLVHEPFDYPDAALDGKGGALGTTGVWTATDSGFAEGWWVHPEGAPSGITTDGPDAPNVFDGTVDNLVTSGGFVGTPGPVERGRDPLTESDSGTGQLDGHIALDPSVTASFQPDTTTWFSFVTARAWDRNEGAPQFMIGTDRTFSRGGSIENEGDGIGGGGGPSRRNLTDLYPQYFLAGTNNHTPGGYDYPDFPYPDWPWNPPRANNVDPNFPDFEIGKGVFGTNDGQQVAFGDGNDATSRGQLDENGQDRTQTMDWNEFDDDGNFGPANIVVGKIEWDADEGKDAISLVRFLETDTLSEAAFDAQIAAQPALSSRNWTAGVWGGDNKPDLNQSQFDTLAFSSLKFFVDEIRLGTDFADVAPSPAGPGLTGDYNASGQVEQGDLDLVLLNWGSEIPPDDVPVGWVNQQPTGGQIDQNELDGALLNWGNTAAVAGADVVPEPASAFLLLIGAFLLGRLRRNG